MALELLYLHSSWLNYSLCGVKYGQTFFFFFFLLYGYAVDLACFLTKTLWTFFFSLLNTLARDFHFIPRFKTSSSGLDDSAEDPVSVASAAAPMLPPCRPVLHFLWLRPLCR